MPSHLPASWPQHVLMHGVGPPQGQDVALPFELHDSREVIIFCMKLHVNTKTTGV